MYHSARDSPRCVGRVTDTRDQPPRGGCRTLVTVDSRLALRGSVALCNQRTVGPISARKQREMEGPRYLIDAQTLQEILIPTGCTRVHCASDCLCELNGIYPHTRASSIDKDFLSWLKFPDIEQCLVGRNGHDRDSARLVRRDTLWPMRDRPSRAKHVLGQRALMGPNRHPGRYRTENLVPDFEPVAPVRIDDLPCEVAFRDPTKE